MTLYGYSRQNITPEFPVVMDGFAAREGMSVGVRDPLFVQALALGDGVNTFLFVAMDLIGLDTALSERMRCAAQEGSGICSKQISLFSTHTHSGPAAGVLHGLYQDPRYWDKVENAMRVCTKKAVEQMRPCTLASAEVPLKLGVNRREFKDGRIQIGHNESLPCDRTLRALCVKENGRVAGVLLNASCHLVTLSAENRRISADLLSVLYKSTNEIGCGGFAMFVNSAAGDINPATDSGEDEEEALEQCGHELVKAATDAVRQAQQEPQAVFFCKETSIRIPVRVPDPQECRNAQEQYRRVLEHAESGVQRYVAEVFLDWYSSRRDAENFITVKVRFYRLGNCAVLALPFEVFTVTRQTLLSAFREAGGDSARLFICSCADGVRGYLPDAKAVREGGYEVEKAPVWYGLPGFYTEESEPAVIAACRGMFACEKESAKEGGQNG